MRNQSGLLVLAALLAVAAPTTAQAPNFDPARPGITRAELVALRATLDSASQSRAYSAALRTEARLLATQAQARLTTGDFQVGDRVIISNIEGQRDTTLAVGADLILIVPVPGAGLEPNSPSVAVSVPLKGVLRAEIEDVVKVNVAKFLVSPAVQVTPLVRITVSGAVGDPGYYFINIDAPLTEAIMRAGGPTATANLGDLRIKRGATPFISGSGLQRDIANGMTPAELGLRPGDEVVVPSLEGRSVGEVVRLVIVALPSLAFLFTML